jgi:SpoIID/LytB domain protein
MKTSRINRILITTVIVILLGLLLIVPNDKQLVSTVVAPPSSFTFIGHGDGHGIGMGQYGAIGDALNFKDTYQTILSDSYPGSHLALITEGNISVLLEETVGSEFIVTSGQSFTLGTVSIPADTYVQIVYNFNTSVWSYGTSSSCAGPFGNFTAVSQPTFQVTQSNTLSDLLNVCENGNNVPYRGEIVASVISADSIAAVNILPVGQYLDSVVPSEMPGYWGTLGSSGPASENWGFQALEAQAVAAASYALSQPNSYGVADICDTTQCQEYRGASAEYPLSTLAVEDTAGTVVMTSSNNIAFTQFSASTGGYSSPGEFPADTDLGDAICNSQVCNPYHTWEITVSASEVTSIFQNIGAPISFDVTTRNGLGEDGGRVLSVEVVGTNGIDTVTGNQLASDFGFYSNWFSFSMPSGNTRGYWVADSAGQVANFGTNMTFNGETVSGAIVSLVPTYDNNGYYLINSNGVVFGFGDATSFNVPTGVFNSNVTAAATGGLGLWVVDSSGQLYSYFAPKLAQDNWTTPAAPIVAVVPYSYEGLWLIDSKGDVYSDGNAPEVNSNLSSTLGTNTIVSAAADINGGLWVMDNTGNVFGLAGATSLGSLSQYGINYGAVAIASDGDSQGYEILTRLGNVVAFGNAPLLGDPFLANMSMSSFVALATADIVPPVPVNLAILTCNTKAAFYSNSFRACIPAPSTSATSNTIPSSDLHLPKKI